MEFRILGPLEVSADGRRLTPGRAKQRALLVLLLLRPNQHVSIDRIVEALWGESPPETARTALHGHVSSLRKLLGPHRIATEPSGYVLNLEPGELDAERFETLVREAGHARDSSSRARLLSEALALWRGEALADVMYLSFAEASLARLRELRLAALEQRIDADLELGRHAQLVPELELLLSVEPLREHLRWQLMLALYRCGRQADALHAYEDERRALSQELGLDPGAMLERLQQQILSRDPGLDLAGKPAPVPTQARKIVTVLVAELVPVDTIDPEDLERIVAPPLARCRSLLERFGATVQPLFSNALVAVFGASRVHEDDSERAVRAAIALREELEDATSLAFRVGVETGSALVTIDGERVEITGAVLSTASGLQAAAPAGAILVGERVYRLTTGAIDYHPSPDTAHVVKRALRPVHASDGPADDIPFIGRQHELALLEATFARALDGGDAQLVTIAGEPGSGKSRLAQQFEILLSNRGPHVWREGRCLPYGDGVTFWALGEIVKAQAGILESDSPEASIDKLRSAVAALFTESGDRAWGESALAPLIGVSDSTTMSVEPSFIAWRRFLEAIASREPLVMLIEDIHWADQALIAFIDHVVDEAGSLPLVIICTARLEFFDAYPTWGGGKHNASAIVLPPLDDLGTEALFEAIIGRPPSSDLVRRAGGNPLFAQELARMVAVSPQTQEVIPDTIQAVIAARLDTLPHDVRETATHAAVVGEVFWSGAVASIVGIDQRESENRLRQLVKARFVRRSRTSSVEGQVEYAFIHALVRDVAYDAIPIRKRPDLHQLAATWLEGLAGDRVSDHAELVAHHYGEALHLMRAAGRRSPELEAKTCQFLILAGDRAMRLDVGAAERFYRRALELSSEGDPQRANVLVRIAGAAQEAGRLSDATVSYKEAIAAFQGRDDWLSAARALMDLSRALWRIGDTARHRAAVDDAIRLLEPHPLGPDLARAWMLKGRGLVHAGLAQESLSWTDRALQSALQVGRPDLKVWSLQYRGMARKYLGDARATEYLQESLRLGLELGLGIETAVCYGNLGDFVSADEGPKEGLRIFSQGIEFSERRGLLHNVMMIRTSVLMAYFELGEWDAALHEADDVLGWDIAQGTTRISMIVLAAKVQILASRGSILEAEAAVNQLLPLARRIGDVQAIVSAMPPAALFEQMNGNLPAAVGLVREVEVATRGLPGWRSHGIADCARVCVAAGDLSLAEALLDGSGATFRRHHGSVLAARAALTEARGEFEKARQVYRETLVLWNTFGHRPEQAYALMGEGRCLAALGRTDAAHAAVEAAYEIFSGLGALPLMQTAR